MPRTVLVTRAPDGCAGVKDGGGGGTARAMLAGTLNFGTAPAGAFIESVRPPPPAHPANKAPTTTRSAARLTKRIGVVPREKVRLPLRCSQEMKKY